ncbi:MAG: CsgG/HfaB family protein [Acidobacteriota bacterium]
MRLACKVMTIILVLVFIQLVNPTVANAQRKSGARPAVEDTKSETKSNQKGGKPRIIITAGATPTALWTVDITGSELENALVQSGRFSVLSRSAFDTILREQKLAQTDLADPSKATEIGKILTARYAVIGKCLSAEVKSDLIPFVNVKKNKLNVVVQMQLIDVETGQIMDSYQYKDKVELTSSVVNEKTISPEDYRNLMRSFASQFLNRLSIVVPVEGLVVLVRGNEVAIDVGAEAAVKPGAEFEVFTQGDPIRNSAGEIISYDRTLYGKIRVVRVEPKIAWAEVLQTYSEGGQPDAAPNTTRIRRDYNVKQISLTPPPNTEEPKKKKK